MTQREVTPKQLPSRVVGRWRLALCVMQFAIGLLVSSWVSRTPEIRDALGATTALMGVVLMGLSVGSMVGVLLSASLVRRFGGWAVMAIGMTCSLTGVSAVAFSTAVGSPVGAFCGLALFGWGYGSQEVALNIEAAGVEKLTGRPALPVVTGSFSFGSVIGALMGMGAVAASVPVPWHLAGIVAVATLAVSMTIRWIPRGTLGITGTGGDGAQPADDAAMQSNSRRPPMWRDRGLVCIAVFMLAIALAEGSAYDWLPLIFVDGYGIEPFYGSAIFALFATAMTIGRFSGSFLLSRFSRVAVMRYCVVTAVVGLLAVVFAPNAYVAGIAVVLWAFGSALGVPVALSAAADDPQHAVARVGVISTAMYIAFLVGPPLLGVFGQHWGIRDSLLIVVVFLAAAGAATAGVRPKSPVAASRVEKLR